MDSTRPVLAIAPAILSVLAACGHTPEAQLAPAAPPVQAPPARMAAPPKAPVPDRSGARVAEPKPQPAPAPSLEERYQQVEQRSIEAVQSGALDTAQRELRKLMPDADAERDFTALFMRYELAWLCWAAQDPKGSLDELRAAEAYMASANFMGNSSVYQGMNVLWFRAFFWLELASEAPASARPGALASALAAKREYEARAGSLGQQAEADLLSALFAVRSGNRAVARKLSRSFHAIAEPDPAELFVMIRVYSAIADSDAATSARQSLERAEPSVLRSLMLRRTEELLPGRRSP